MPQSLIETPVASFTEIEGQLSDQSVEAIAESGLGPDAESREWVSALSAVGPRRDGAEEELYQLLLRAARFEVQRRRAGLGHLRGGDFEDLATQAAGDAMVAILAKLDTYRGESRFTTWAYKFGLLEAAVVLRRRAWQGKEIVLEPEAWSFPSPDQLGPERASESRELIDAIAEAMRSELTGHQREVLSAVALNGVPIDVLAERLQTTRGALYKTIHDARKRLRTALAAADFELDGDRAAEDWR